MATGAGSPVVRTSSLRKQFGDVVAVEALELAVSHGEVFGLVGPDGAGKTTVLRLLTAVLAPTSGSAEVLGHDVVENADAIRADIGYMAQRFTLYRDLTVLENLNFLADSYSVPKSERTGRIARLLAFAGLSGFKDRLAGQLSGGMQKKLALAGTLVHAPKVLFLDEPTTGVDPVSRREFWEILTELHLDGITILVSTPYMDEAERCSRVGLMHHGQLIECDTPERLRALVGGQMLEVRTKDLRRAASLVSAVEGVREVQTYGDRLHALVDDRDELESARLESEVLESLTSGGITVEGIRTTRPRMEEAFISLVGQESAETDA